MLRVSFSLLPVIFALVLPGCGPHKGHSAEFFVFGTLVEVHLPQALGKSADDVIARLAREFQRMHEEWHAWEPGELVRLNRNLQAGLATETTPGILELIRQSHALERESGGYFNPAIGMLIELWGFHTSDFPITGPPPGAQEINALVRASPSSLDIRIDGNRVVSDNPAVQLDFGAIAKGYALDIAIDIIRGSGIDSAIVNAGGDMRVIGSNLGKPWRVGVQNPAGGVAGTILVSGDLAVFTSGNYARFRQDSRERYPHILDPRSGWPVESVASATVIATNGAAADAAATALMVAGLDEWPETARNMGIEAALVIDETGVIHATREMMDFFTPANGSEVAVLPGD